MYHQIFYIMKLLKPTLAALAGLLVFAACTKKNYEPDEKDATAQISVLDEKGAPLGGVPVLIFDEKGYEKFQKDRSAAPAAFTLTLPDGKVSYRLPFREWFASGNRVITFVVREEGDADNYRIWAISRTVGAAETFNIAFKLDRNPFLPQ